MKTAIQTPVQTVDAIVAVLDADAPAKTAQTGRALVPTQIPDFIDNGFAWWIGEHGAVGCDADMPGKGVKAESGGHLARQGDFPAMHGFVVMPHDPDYRSGVALSKHQDVYDLWRIVQDAVLMEVDE